jgi:hypothetical protein
MSHDWMTAFLEAKAIDRIPADITETAWHRLWNQHATCDRCGRTIRVTESTLLAARLAGMLPEFYYCADRTACATRGAEDT